MRWWYRRWRGEIIWWIMTGPRFAAHTLYHRWQHLTLTNKGKVETWNAKCGKVMLGFRCQCGEMHGIHPAQTERHPQLRPPDL